MGGQKGESHIFEAGAYSISVGENVWRMSQENRSFAAALYVVARDTEGGAKGGAEVLRRAVAELAKMSRRELRAVSTLQDVLRPPSSFP